MSACTYSSSYAAAELLLSETDEIIKTLNGVEKGNTIAHEQVAELQTKRKVVHTHQQIAEAIMTEICIELHEIKSALGYEAIDGTIEPGSDGFAGKYLHVPGFGMNNPSRAYTPWQENLLDIYMPSASAVEAMLVLEEGEDIDIIPDIPALTPGRSYSSVIPNIVGDIQTQIDNVRALQNETELLIQANAALKIVVDDTLPLIDASLEY